MTRAVMSWHVQWCHETCSDVMTRANLDVSEGQNSIMISKIFRGLRPRTLYLLVSGPSRAAAEKSICTSSQLACTKYFFQGMTKLFYCLWLQYLTMRIVIFNNKLELVGVAVMITWKWYWLPQSYLIHPWHDSAFFDSRGTEIIWFLQFSLLIFLIELISFIDFGPIATNW
jgi:hypothetical protein